MQSTSVKQPSLAGSSVPAPLSCFTLLSLSASARLFVQYAALQTCDDTTHAAGGEHWRVRRRAVGPSLHRAYLAAMIDRVFGESAVHLNGKLAKAARDGSAVDIEALFSQLTLDVIGKAVFNYNFDALDKDSDIIQAVYTALKEAETRATDLLPFWKLPGASLVVPRQRKAVAAVRKIRETTEMLIARCKQMVDDEEQAAAAGDEEYLNTEDPSVLRFLIASRDEVSAEQLRDDLLGMLVAGHETTGSVLTWTTYFLAQSPEHTRKLQARCFSCTSVSMHKGARGCVCLHCSIWRAISCRPCECLHLMHSTHEPCCGHRWQRLPCRLALSVQCQC